MSDNSVYRTLTFTEKDEHTSYEGTAFRSTHHHYTKAFGLAYVVEACLKYESRGVPNVLDTSLRDAITGRA